jgi:uncharacterized protein (TIGR03435 family)
MALTQVGIVIGLTVLTSTPFGCFAAAAQSFAAASIKPSAAAVQFERDGKTETSPGNLRMRDVTVGTCIKWAYDVQDSQISGPEWIQSERFDIIAKSDEPVPVSRLKLMLQALLADRFGLRFHRQTKELRSYAMTLSKSGHELHESASDAIPSRQNSATSTIAKAMTMKEFGDFLAGPLRTPVVDMTGLSGRYDFVLDFTPYIPEGEQAMKPDYANTNGIIIAALQGELGLKLESKKESVDVLVIDHVEKPSQN